MNGSCVMLFRQLCWNRLATCMHLPWSCANIVALVCVCAKNDVLRARLHVKLAFVVIRQRTGLMPPEADLGMFIMFGRTGAPQKGGPHKSTKKSFFATW